VGGRGETQGGTEGTNRRKDGQTGQMRQMGRGGGALPAFIRTRGEKGPQMGGEKIGGGQVQLHVVVKA